MWVKLASHDMKLKNERRQLGSETFIKQCETASKQLFRRPNLLLLSCGPLSLKSINLRRIEHCATELVVVPLRVIW